MLNTTLRGEKALRLNSSSHKRLQLLGLQGDKKSVGNILVAIITFNAGEGNSGKVNSKLTI